MSEIVTLAAEARDRAGKGAARAVRRAGRIPAVIYGGKAEPVTISLDPKAFGRELHRPGFFSHLIDIELDGKKHRTLARDVQLHPVTDLPLHVDFVRIVRGAAVTVEVPVHFLNQEASPGIKRGGVLNIVRHELELSCPADAIPERIDIDLTGLEIGDSVHFSAITLPDKVSSTIGDRDFTVATIAAPTVSQEEVDEADAPAVPEGEPEPPEEQPEE